MPRKKAKRTKRSVAKFAAERHRMRQRQTVTSRHLEIRLKNAPVALSPRVKAQVECHRVFDMLWVGPEAPLIRTRAYAYLSKITGLPLPETHIAQFDLGMCEGVVAKVKEDYPRLFLKSA